MFADDPTTAGAQGPGGDHEVGVAHLDHRRAHDAGHRCPAQDSQRQDYLAHFPVQVGAVRRGNELRTRMPPSSSGIPKKMSVSRDRMESTQPPKNPAMTPMKPPTSMVKAVAKTPTRIDALAP